MRKMLAVLVSVIILISCSFQPSTQEKLGAKESTSSPRELQMVASQTPDQIGAASESVKEPEKPANNLKVDSLELILTVPSKGYLVGNQYAYMLGGNIQVSNLTTGASDWVTNVGDGWLMHADEQNLYVKQADQRIDAYDVQTGEFRWKVLLPGPYLAIVNYRDEHLVYIISVDLSTGQVTMLIVDKVSGEVLQTVDDFVPSINDFSSLVGYQDLMIFRSRGQLGKELFAWSPVKQTSVYHILEDSSINCGTVNIIAASSSSRETQYGGYDALNGSLLWSREFPETLKKNLHCGSKLETNPASMWLVGGALWYEPQIYSESPLPFFFTQQREDLTAVDLKSGEILWVSSDHLWQGITFSRGDWLGEVGNALIYSSSAYGITHAYAADSHQFLWENSNIQIDSVIGRAKNIIVALSLGEYGGFTTVKKMYGLDQGTGELLWTVDMGSQPLNAISVLDDWILWNSHYQQTKHQIHIVSAKTGVEQQVFSAPGAGIGYFQEGDLIIVDTWEQIFIFK